MKHKTFGSLKILLTGAVSFPGGLVGSYCRAFEKLGMNVLSFDPGMGILKLLQRDLCKEGERLIDKARRRLRSYLLHFSAQRLQKKRGFIKEAGRFGDRIQMSLVGAQNCFFAERANQGTRFHFNADSRFDKQLANSQLSLR